MRVTWSAPRLARLKIWERDTHTHTHTEGDSSSSVFTQSTQSTQSTQYSSGELGGREGWGGKEKRKFSNFHVEEKKIKKQEIMELKLKLKLEDGLGEVVRIQESGGF